MIEIELSSLGSFEFFPSLLWSSDFLADHLYVSSGTLTTSLICVGRIGNGSEFSAGAGLKILGLRFFVVAGF